MPYHRHIVEYNAARCRLCNTVLESRTVHDFKACKCGALMVDGGREYVRRVWDGSKGDYDDIAEELSIEYDEEQETLWSWEHYDENGNVVDESLEPNWPYTTEPVERVTTQEEFIYRLKKLENE